MGKNDRFYYISHGDGCVHNINDVEHFIENKEGYIGACIGKDLGEEGFRVDEEVVLHTIADIVELFKELKGVNFLTNKDKPIKIQWNEYARGFYCPICFTGTASNTQQCKYCGQKLLPMYNFK